MNKLAQQSIGSFFNTRLGNDLTISGLVAFFLQAAMVIAGVVLLFLIVGGGIGMIAGAGSGDSARAAQGKKAVTSALIGFIIILGAYWVIRIIELIIGCRIVTEGIGQC